jgi:hypothetical protein
LQQNKLFRSCVFKELQFKILKMQKTAFSNN